MFAQLYMCSEHKEVWRVSVVEEIDCENDEIYPHTVCDICGRAVEPIMHEDKPVYHVLTPDEMYWDMMSFGDEDEEDDPFDEDAHPRTCETCGGEIAGSWSTCTCEEEM